MRVGRALLHMTMHLHLCRQHDPLRTAVNFERPLLMMGECVGAGGSGGGGEGAAAEAGHEDDGHARLCLLGFLGCL